MTSKILLKNGLVLLHTNDDVNPTVEPHEGTDVLIEGSTIAKVGRSIHAQDDATTIDCTGKIVSPGFISTHSHLWQSQLKGIHSEDTLFDYMPKGNFMSKVFNPSDTYWAVQATIDAGLRCVWAYAEPVRVESWTREECTMSMQIFQESTMSCLEQLARRHNRPSTNGTFSVGFAYDLWFLPTEMLQPIHDRLTSAGVTTLTTHVGRDAVQGLGDPLTMIKSKAPFLFSESANGDGGIKNIVISHAMNVKPPDFKTLFSPDAEVHSGYPNISISTTPETESHMCMHRSVAFSHPSTCPVPSHKVSLGIDCHTAASSFMPHAARIGLVNARIRSNEILFRDNDAYARTLLGPSGSELFNSFTVNGAKALGLDHDSGGIGRIRVGRKADLVVFDASESISMGTGVEFDPVIAITRLSEIHDVDTVIVDGVIKKQNKKLLPINASDVAGAGIEKAENVSWADIRKELSKSFAEIKVRMSGLSIDKAKEMMVSAWHIDTGKFSDVQSSI